MNSDVLVKFYAWAFSECDRIDALNNRLDAQVDLMSVVRKVNKVSLYTTTEERNDAIEQALLIVDKPRLHDGTEVTFEGDGYEPESVQRSEVEPSVQT